MPGAIAPVHDVGNILLRYINCFMEMCLVTSRLTFKVIYPIYVICILSQTVALFST